MLYNKGRLLVETLSQNEAQELIVMLKKTLVAEIKFPTKGTQSEFKVQGPTRRHVFAINIFRGRIDKDKYNINARISKNGIMLMQLHIGETIQHMNPDRRKVNGSHWHFYHEEHGMGIAEEAENINSTDFVKNTILLFDKFNILEKPKISYQLEML